ncbi:hypothetical protein GE21DRAFT_2428 [Neurospora crassa]|uniref:Uncharacterized protein n=1 Tax=Neurospora crassa (strain ATCC 24698 / 74-OR23-1A / CBS 708.71 / DSM 1257 / FGSC 987) TaxID=367110 RepID=Q7SDC7_NEUCR|nr:hypothetical protein NCU02865 [Neurospora crassa OR74A]EAA34763.2 hypothetical protein NCU02865 [Neurospora crassa OR74A]KHE78690.1 hypothetical protein GE21DRAFT_2428 [Neurospora crassa]|eukprot:XP_963999.2 hypothetical protein NCU02865 [Neurospora crassa OR74A]
MDFFLPFIGVLGSQALLSARNIFGAGQTTKPTSTESVSTYQDPWSESSIESSGCDKPVVASTTSEKKDCANDDTSAVKKQNKDPRMTHIGADVSASKSDESKVSTDKNPPTANSDDEMILDCITVQSHFVIGITSSPTDNQPITSSLKKRKWEESVRTSLFDVLHSPSPKKRLTRSPPATTARGISFNTRTPLRNTTATKTDDHLADTPTPSKIRLRLTSPVQMAVYNSKVARTPSSEPEVSNSSVGGAPDMEWTEKDMAKKKEKPKAGESVDQRPKTQTPRHRIRQRTSQKTWDDLSVVDHRGLLDTKANQQNSTGTPRRKLQQCKWVRYREPEINVLMPDAMVNGRVPRLVLTDPEGRHYSLEDMRFSMQMALSRNRSG